MNTAIRPVAITVQTSWDCAACGRGGRASLLQRRTGELGRDHLVAEEFQGTDDHLAGGDLRGDNVW